MKTRRQNRRSERGLTIVEALVAITVFTVVFIAALMLYSVASNAYLRTDSAVIQQQNIRFTMDRMSETLRDAGAGHNMYGSKKLADEQIEGAWESAVFVRGDFDGQEEDNLESATFPIVTTGNDEIVGFVLLKNGAGTLPISIKADLTGTGGSDDRDAIFTSNSSITNEETVTVNVAATTVAQQTNPPYQLAKVTFNASGAAQYEIIADNIYQLKFDYYPATGSTAITTGIGSGADTERDERATIRKIAVRLTGQTDRADMSYGTGTGYRTFPLEQVIVPANLGITGGQHALIPSLNLPAPAYVTTCTGHCRTHLIQWPASAASGITKYAVKITADAATNGATGATVGPYSYVATASAAALQYEFQHPAEDIAKGIYRTFSFAVAPMSGNNIGTYSPVVAQAHANQTPASTPSAPGNVNATAATGELAMLVTWSAVQFNTGTISGGSLCASAGSGSVTNNPPDPWNRMAVDLTNAKVYRARSTGTNNGTAATTDVSSAAIGTLQNVPSTSNFVDRTAAPCTPYFYRVKACDLCTIESAYSDAMAQPKSFDIATGINPGKPQNVTSAANITTDGTNFIFNLTWDPVVKTDGDVPAATAHYRIYRASKIGVNGTYSTAALIGELYEPTTPFAFPQTVPQRNGAGQDLHYRYWVEAVYDCATPRKSELGGPFDVTCAPAAGTTATITGQTDGSVYSRPTDTSVPLELTVSSAAFAAAEMTVLDETGTTVVYQPPALTGAPGTGNKYTFTAWDIQSASLPDGIYILSAAATTSAGCRVAADKITVELETIACGQRIVSADYTGDGTGTFARAMTFKIENTCPNAVTISSLVPKWTGVLSTRRITKLYGPTITHWNGSAASGDTMTFTVPLTLTAGSISSPSQVSLTFDFSSNFTSDGTKDGTAGIFNSIVAGITLPSVTTEQLVDGGTVP